MSALSYEKIWKQLTEANSHLKELEAKNKELIAKVQELQGLCFEAADNGYCRHGSDTEGISEVGEGCNCYGCELARKLKHAGSQETTK